MLRLIWTIVIILFLLLLLVAITAGHNVPLERFISLFLPQFKKKESTTRREDQCRKIIERLTGHSFSKVRPDFLINPETGRRLELDCYNPLLKIALEYNGEQHYRFIPYFHQSEKDFEKQVQRDELKKKLCEENGIKLITVPFNVTDLEEFIQSKLQKIEF